ncbi:MULTISPECIES: exosortase/archaeosortase family protein [unclassified Microbacterium]|uniref:exosortase/archaeosortase family protein n=1 Tax=unclassified Microbacterium TaxID=2609290 RepID=UPI001604264B|nr:MULTISPECIES: exosortase/archaeosortase family protein [unclassified Microbacterium]MBT2483981.1 archaeosortase/exosortase family protein [Microbacterium sp. ISL-108]
MTAITATRRGRREGGVRKTPVRIGVFALLLLVSAGMLWTEAAFRTLEAAAAASWLNLFLGPVTSSGPHYLVPIGDTGAVLLRVSPECSVLLLIIPILVILSFFALHGRTPLPRVILAALVTIAGLFLVNQIRLGVIAVATNVWGMDPGYELSHVLVGSLIGILGFVGALLAALLIMGVRRKRR